MTPAILKSISKKNRLYRKQLKNPTLQNVSDFKKYSNLLGKIIKNAKADYYDNKFKENFNDIKKSWDLIREVLKTSKKKEKFPSKFLEDGKPVDDDKSIAEGFNHFFANIGPELAKKIPTPDTNFKDYLGNRASNLFKFSTVSTDTVARIIRSLKPKSSFGTDEISNKLLKEIMPEILTPLTHLINQSLSTGYIHPELKTAKIIPDKSLVKTTYILTIGPYLY